MVGREYQHLEDLTFIESQGAARALYVLKNIHSYTTSIKWDGNPTIYFGRDQNNNFSLSGKNGWGKHTAGSPGDLENWINTRGKGEFWRKHYARAMAEMWETLESEFTFKGYLYADVMWGPTSHLGMNSEHLYFRPNIVTYMVETKSELGKRLKSTKMGLTAHKHYANFGDREGVDVGNYDYSTKSVAFLTQNLLSKTYKSPDEELKNLEKLINKNVNVIDELFFFTPPGMTDIRNIIYTYVNYTVKERKFKSLNNLKIFEAWIETSKLSFPKQGKLKKMIVMHEDKFQKLFDTILAISNVKDLFIEEMVKSVNGIKFMRSHPAGEGFVLNEPKLKFVPRTTWIPR